MKWLKKGVIFDPRNYDLANNCKTFAQSPQVLSFSGFNRVYFSTREITPGGKFVSHISFVDFTKGFSKILRISENTVIPLGGLGTYDQHGIFPLNVLRDGSTVLGFIGGWNRRVSVSVDTAIGLAVSTDNGETFERVGPGPILSATVDEPFLVGDPFVLKIDKNYHMWYIYGQRWVLNTEAIPERVYKIGYAISSDLIEWKRTGRQIVKDVLNKDECQALPTIAKWRNRYHMIFCYREAIGFRVDPSKGYRLGYAWSEDLVNWTRADEEFRFEGESADWDNEMQCYPHLFRQEDELFLLYNGNKFGKYGFGIAKLIED